MANVKISEMPSVAASADTDQFEVEQGGTSKKATLAQIKSQLAGTSVGKLVQLESDGASPESARIPALDGSQLTGITQSQVSGIRELLTANTTYYVNASTGNDSTGNGSSGAPWATLQKAADHIYSRLDCGGYTVTVDCTGTFTAGVNCYYPIPGGGVIRFDGDTSTPSNVQVNTTSDNCFDARGGANIQVQGFKMTTTSSGSCIYVSDAGTRLALTGAMDFGACAESHIRQLSQSSFVGTNYTISAGVSRHWLCQLGAVTEYAGVTITLSGTPAWGTEMARFDAGALASFYLVTFSGSATGKRHDISGNAVVNTYGGSEASYFPGNSAGSRTTGGQWL